jgi:PDGLE domain-containing protein
MSARAISMRLFVALALSVAIGLAFFLSPYASSSPDGLNRVAGDKGFDNRATLHSIQDDSPIPGYAFPGIDDEKLAKGVAGFVGTLGVFTLGYGAALTIRRTRA